MGMPACAKKCLAKDFGAFETRGGLGWSDNPQAAAAKFIDDASD